MRCKSDCAIICKEYIQKIQKYKCNNVSICIYYLLAVCTVWLVPRGSYVLYIITYRNAPHEIMFTGISLLCLRMQTGMSTLADVCVCSSGPGAHRIKSSLHAVLQLQTFRVIQGYSRGHLA